MKRAFLTITLLGLLFLILRAAMPDGLTAWSAMVPGEDGPWPEHVDEKRDEPVATPVRFPLDRIEAGLAQLAWAEKLDTPLQISNSRGMRLILIPPGQYVRGSPEDEPHRRDNETQHKVTLTKPFRMSVTEVTQKQWHSVMGRTLQEQADLDREMMVPGSLWQLTRFGEGDDYPIYLVSWQEAQEFCRRLTVIEQNAGRISPDQVYRLPTEAEWEYACRAGSTRRFHFGDSEAYLPRAEWTASPDPEDPIRLHPVAQKLPNAWGLYDMAGNVGEWCADWLGDYPQGPVIDPTGPEDGESRVIRGRRAARLPADNARSALRWGGPPEIRIPMIGFRVVLTLP